jgi:broad specificity phosphatase PhoE
MGIPVSKHRNHLERNVHYVVQFVSACEVPKTDILTESDPYLRARVINIADKRPCSSWVRTPIIWDTRNPVWKSYRDFGLVPHDTDHALVVELWDAEKFSQNEFIGRATIPISEIEIEVKQFPFQLKSDLKELQGKCLISLCRVQPSDAPRVLYLVRHGQSIWNEAVSDLALHRMIAQVDHPLNTTGIAQAGQLASHWKAAAAGVGHVSEYEREFINADTVFSSPMTRAFQTALVGLHTHPALAKSGITLLPLAREIKKTFAMDTVGLAIGAEVPVRAFALLEKMVPNPPEDMFGRDMVAIDVGQLGEPWWTRLHSVDTDTELGDRMHDLLCRVRYGSAECAILVGHSLFFRELLRRYLCDRFRSAVPVFARQLMSDKLCNAGCLRLSLDWSSQRCIADVALVFGSKLVTSQKIWTCGAPDASQA